MSAIGLRVGPYEIVGRTPVPEPGDWHLARRTGNPRRTPAEVLVRLLPPDASPDDREALHHQYEVLRALEDPRVPEAIGFYEGLGAMALAAVHGTSLADVVKGRQNDIIAMSPSTLLDVVLELAETMQRAHHRNRFHGDLSPDRVLLGADGRLWVFGFGRPLQATANPEWVAPEVRDGEGAGPTTDQWYLGVLAAALVGGGAPWPDGNTDGIEALLAPAESQWPALGRLLRRMTEPKPADRYPSMHPVRQELLALARKAGGLSERRILGGDLARPRPMQVQSATPSSPPEPVRPEPAPEPPPQPAPEAPPAPDLPPDGFAPGTDVPELKEDFPPPDVEVDLTISEEYIVPNAEAQVPAQPLRDPSLEGRTPLAAPRVDLPDEDFVVVRPDVGTELPTATLQDAPPPEPEEEAEFSDAALHDVEPRGLGAPIAPAGDAEPLLAGVVVEPTDPDAGDASSGTSGEPPPPDAGEPAAPSPPLPPSPEPDMSEPVPSTAFPSVPSDLGERFEPNPFATDHSAEVEADAASAPGAGDGMSWDDLAREFATDVGAHETLQPASDAALADIEPSAETEQSEPKLMAIPPPAAGGPGSDASLGIRPIDTDELPPEVQGLSEPSGPERSDLVPTSTLIQRVAPIAVGIFLLVFVVWVVVSFVG